MSIAAGQAVNSTSVQLMVLTAIAKTTSAWAAGTAAGGLDTGTIANNTWYHFYVIRRPDTGVVDVVFSTNATSPTLPTNYTQFRRIGSMATTGAAQWVRFNQYGDDFWLYNFVNSYAVNNPGVAAATVALYVPLGISVLAHVNNTIQNTGTGGSVLSSLTDLASPAVTPSAGYADTGYAAWAAGNALVQAARVSVQTNISQQIRREISFSDVSVSQNIVVRGWTDTRGRSS